jgi:hypothetical protein
MARDRRWRGQPSRAGRSPRWQSTPRGAGEEALLCGHPEGASRGTGGRQVVLPGLLW